MTLAIIIKRLEEIQVAQLKTGTRVFSDTNDKRDASAARESLSSLVADLKAQQVEETT